MNPADIVCLSHLRWDFVYQRPNHLMARAAKSRRVFFIEEPQRTGWRASFETSDIDGVVVARPILPRNSAAIDDARLLRRLLNRFLETEHVRQPWLWYYTPMARPWTRHIGASAVVYDCMDELSGFKDAPPAVRPLEQELMKRADVVFTGGRSLYLAKRSRHERTFMFPSSVDADHFRRARRPLPDPADQVAIGRPRIGYFGVVDERIDLGLIAHLAKARPDWNIVMVGPTAKISERDLPRATNIHWLGMKTYEALPGYLSGWDVAIMPFALNEATRHISPTKTPEYLSGGKPVVTTPIEDVVNTYGDQRLVHVAADATTFEAAVEEALSVDHEALMARADTFLADQSWDATWSAMERLVMENAPGPTLELTALATAPQARMAASRARQSVAGRSALPSPALASPRPR